MSIEKEKILFNRSYYNRANFYNIYLSSILAINDYFVEAFFPNDPSRLIYSSNDHAFRRRLKLQSSQSPDVSQFQINTLNMPFMNFSVTSSGISSDTNRTLKNNQLEKFGVMDWNLKKKIKATPVKINFEATYFSTEEIDIQYIMSVLQWDSALESLIKPKLEIDGNTYLNYGYLDIDSIDYNPTYDEDDWLQQNKIRTIGISFSLDTYSIRLDDSDFWIPKNVLLSFATSKDLEIHDLDNYDELITGIIDYIEGTVAFS